MHWHIFLKFHRKSTIRSNLIVQIPADVYTFMFLCDLINFFVLMFGFSAFSVRLTIWNILPKWLFKKKKKNENQLDTKVCCSNDSSKFNLHLFSSHKFV